MLRLRLPVFLILCAAILPAAHADQAVYVREPMVLLVRRADLPKVCGIDGVAACTSFVGQRLDCSCEKSGQAWRIRAHAQFIPVMHLPDAVWIAHERDHIADIRQAVESHLLLLGMRHFDSQSNCRAEAGRQMAGFVRLMDQFKLDSEEVRHPRLAKLMKAK